MSIQDSVFEITDTREAFYLQGILGNLDIIDVTNYPESNTDPKTSLDDI